MKGQEKMFWSIKKSCRYSVNGSQEVSVRLVFPLMILAHLSRRLIGKLIVYEPKAHR